MTGLHDDGFGDLAAALLQAAFDAGQAILDVYDAEIGVSYKADASPVTQADTLAEVIILDALRAISPDTPAVAEESVAQGLPYTGRRFFLVDPLDGTKEFISRNGEFTVNIALVEDGVPVFGLISAPALGRYFVTLSRTEVAAAEAGPRARPPALNEAGWRTLRARARPDGGGVFVASRSHRNAETDAFLDKHGAKETVSVGSSLKFCLVAAGEADVYPRLGPTNEWDTAAGHAIVQAAGGCVLTEDGQPLLYGKRHVAFRNPGFVVWGQPPQRA